MAALAEVARSIAGAGAPAEWGPRAVAVVARATGWERVFLFRVADAPKVLRLVAAAGVTPEQRRESAELPLSGPSLSALAVHRAAPVIAGKTVLPGPIETNRRRGGAPSYAAFPLIARGRILGTLTLLDATGGDVDGEQAAFLGAVADQLAVGLDSAQLYEDARHREALAVFLREISDLLGSSPDVEAALRLVADRCVGVLGDGCGIFLNPRESCAGDRLRLVAAAHRRPGFTPRLRCLLEALAFRAGAGAAGTVAATGRPLLAADLSDPALDLPPEALARARGVPTRGCIVAPLRTRRRSLGLLVCIATEEPDAAERPAPVFGAPVGGPLRPSDAEVALEVCQRIGPVLENARLYLAAEDSRQRLRQTFNQMSDGVLVLDTEGRITEFNEAAAQMLGGGVVAGVVAEDVPSLEEIRQADGDVLPADRAPSALAPAGDRPMTNLQLTLVHTHGATVEVSAGAVPLHDETGRNVGAVTVLRDVSDLRRLERAKDTFVNVTSHELRTPLTPLKGLTQILLRQLTAPAGVERRLDLDRVERYLRTMDAQVDRLAALVNDLLDVSRMKAGRLHLRPTEIDLVEVVRSVLERFESLADVELRVPERDDAPDNGRPSSPPRGESGASLAGLPAGAARRGTHRIVFAPSMPHLLGVWDPLRLEQALTNLVANSLKYSPEGGDVLVTLELEGVPLAPHAHLAVRDAGIGIPAEQAAELFRPFSRLANAPAEHFGGLGLGLYIAYDIVERHGGRIWAESAGPGQGATFHITLPLRDAP
jgi:signal transduction histidine kinase